VYIRAQPITEELCRDLEEGVISMSTDLNGRVAKLADVHLWPREQARKVLAISGSCILFDCFVALTAAQLLAVSTLQSVFQSGTSRTMPSPVSTSWCSVGRYQERHFGVFASILWMQRCIMTALIDALTKFAR
jgi:hypothetical protein